MEPHPRLPIPEQTLNVICSQCSPKRVERLSQLIARHPREKSGDVDDGSSTEGEKVIKITRPFGCFAEAASQRERSDS